MHLEMYLMQKIANNSNQMEHSPKTIMFNIKILVNYNRIV